MPIKVNILSAFDNKGIKQAQSQFGQLGKSLKGLVGAAGIAVSLGAVTSALREATKQASNDAKSQVLLAQQLRNTAGASQEQITAVEESIAKMSIMSAIADDQLRPAMASLVRATGDVTKAQDLLGLSLDVSAATGKDLSSVSLAIGKAVSGQTQALFRMIPGLKGSTDWMSKLKSETQGMAEAAGDKDPYMRLTVIFDEMQETIGTYLLPYLQEFSSYIASPEGQSKLAEFAEGVGTIAKNMVELGKAMGSNEFINGLASFSTFLAQLSGGNFGGALDTINKRQAALSKQLETPAMRDMRLSVKSKSSNKAVADAAKKEIAAVKAAEKATRSAYNRYASLTEMGKSLGLNIYSTNEASPFGGGDDKGKGSSASAKAAKAAADKAAKARKAIIDAAQKASDDAKEAFDTLKDAVDGFNKSFAQTADAFRVIFKFSAPLGEFEQQTVDAFQSMRDAAQAAYEAGLFGKDKGAAATLANLKAYADREQALLQGIAKQRDVLAKKISIAQSVTSGIMGSLNITSMLETETKQVTKSVSSLVNGIALTTTQTFDEVVSGGLADSFKKLVDKTKAFASNLIKLKALGLNGNLFKQIVDAGAEAGGATAEAIVAGGADTVKELNGLFKDLTDAGASIAETATPVMYDLGENMTNSFIDGLRSQDQMLIDSANSMAALFTEQFRSQLNLAIAPTVMAAQDTGIKMQSALDLSKRPDPVRSPQSYANWLSSIGGIDPVRSPQSYAAAQAATTYNVTINANAITDKQSLPALVTDALVTASKQGLTGGLSRLLAV